MAIQTIILNNFEGGNVRCELDWDDVAKVPTAIRQINNSLLPASGPRAVESRLTLIKPDGTEDPTKRFPADGSFYRTPAGSTSQSNVPAAVASQFPLTVVNLRGRLVIANLSAETHFPIA